MVLLFEIDFFLNAVRQENKDAVNSQSSSVLLMTLNKYLSRALKGSSLESLHENLKTGVFKRALFDCFYKLFGSLILYLRQVFAVDFINCFNVKVKNHKCHCFLWSNSKIKANIKVEKSKFLKSINLMQSFSWEQFKNQIKY